METPLLNTKLYIPALRSDLIKRVRLLNKIEKGLNGKLILVSAPAGFGKSTLVAMWARDSRISLGWVSLDNRDNDPVVFLTYIFTAINSVGHVGDTVLAEIRSPQRPPEEEILKAWINELSNHPHKLILVLDDYHVIENPAIHQNVEFLLENLPPNFHLIVISRSDPNLQLARIRGCGQMTEIREADLRFTENEASEFFKSVLDLHLSAQNISALEQRTEGWAVGLQLAGLALQGRKDIEQFIQKFSGGHHHIIDYLTQEVFDRQPEYIQVFLLQTSILERMCASLCDVLTGENTGTSILHSLDQRNLFVIPLDDERQWYRYHHMFSDLLRYQLEHLYPGWVKDLHKRAGIWYAEHNFPDEALQHLQAVEEFALAAEIIESLGPDLIGQGKLTLLKSWIENLPETIIKDRHYLCLYHAWVLNLTNQVNILEARLQDTERALAHQTLDDRTVADVRGQIAQIRAYDARRRKNLALSIEYLNGALNLLPEDSFSARSAALFHLGLTYIHQGKLVKAAQALADARPLSELGGNLYVTLATTGYLADVQIAQGHLRQAAQFCEQTIEESLARHQPEALSGLAYVYVSLGKIHYERNDLEKATMHLVEGITLGERTANWRATMAGIFALAWLRQMLGYNDEADALLQKATALADRSRMSFREMDLDAWQARINLAQNKVVPAVKWATVYQADKARLPTSHEFSDSVQARILIAQKKFSRALGLLEQQCQKFETIGADGRLIESLMLEALVKYAQEDKDQAYQLIEKALAKAEAEGYIRIFIDEGPAMIAFLTEFLNWSEDELVSTSYIKRLLEAFPEEQIQAYKQSLIKKHTIDSLNDREQQILYLLAAGLKTPEIADELHLANSTIKWYRKNIYAKLGVNRRADAIARAKELNIIE